ncbi:MAG: dTDP-glucose 4,6-dehydratase [Candidatus Pacebacteria bacterium CG11_big_fil_rev_8_21_14_0_20_34_55]|nr:dTDP-glucose 4,6-dehydratase [Candidatus Pacearchaeota archaeon]NCQ65768.1 dTDP-glucose 4,6-dehydratase [Candidatus Paceibacterota bacterium]NCS86950.1 dTDP-glucose 4,6-dehydratase [Candidatus Paceibacterota bacterium]PIQ81125.1 MAG: dTDP-glucose 4,6-dehydratase [Candidatus Pacebacteria bacterium CG11_big_fil_rev_8_21_14_0_20_34_55]
MKDNSTLLVTGGAGFIGSNFIIYWLNKYPESKIINLDSLTYAGNLSSLKTVEDNPNYTFIEGNITNSELVDKIMDDVDVVVHFAAESHVDRSILDPGIFLETNVLGTHVLLASALKNKIDRFHYISTDEVFGSLELGNPNSKFSESTAYDPRSPYSASKASSDHLVRAYGETYGLNYTITNCSNNYGELQYPEKFIPLAITNLMEGKKIPVYGDGLQVRDWLYVQDHCDAIDRVLHSDKSQETYVVGGLTKEVPNIEIVKMIVEIMGKDETQIEYVKDRAGHDRRYSVDWSKINKELGWKPTVSFEEGLKKTIEWYQLNQEWWKPLKIDSKDFFAKNYD